MGETLDLLRRGFADGLQSGCECMSQDEMASVASLTVSAFQEMLDEGTLEPCPRHPTRFRASLKSMRDSIKLLRADPDARRLLG